MSTRSELYRRLGHRVPIRDADPHPLPPDELTVYILRRTGPMHKPVSVAQRLRQAGSTLRAAHIAINRLADAGWAVCSLARMENPAALAHDLAAMNVQARRRMIPSEEAEDVAAIRVRHGLSQREFADLLGLDVRTLQNWEQGRNRPDPAALVLMRVFEHAPQVVEEAISEPVA